MLDCLYGIEAAINICISSLIINRLVDSDYFITLIIMSTSRISKMDLLSILLLYVDGILITSKKTMEIEESKVQLRWKFEIKDLGRSKENSMFGDRGG